MVVIGVVVPFGWIPLVVRWIVRSFTNRGPTF